MDNYLKVDLVDPAFTCIQGLAFIKKGIFYRLGRFSFCSLNKIIRLTINISNFVCTSKQGGNSVPCRVYLPLARISN